jgi:hypothetical protein
LIAEKRPEFANLDCLRAFVAFGRGNTATMRIVVYRNFLYAERRLTKKQFLSIVQ